MRVKIGADASGVKRAAKVAVAAIAGIGIAAVAVAAKSIQAASKQEKAYISLAVRVGDEAAKAFAKFAAELQSVTTIGDEVAIQAASIGASFGLTGEKLELATKAAADMSATYGTDLSSAMRVVGQGLTGQISMLGRFVPQLKGAKFEALGFDGVLRALNENFGGAAEAQARTFAGRLTQLKNVFGDNTEEVGKLFTESGVLNQLLVEMRDTVFGIGEDFKKFREEVRPLAEKVFRQFAIAVVTSVGELRKLAAVINAFIKTGVGGVIVKIFATPFKIAAAAVNVFNKTLDNLTERAGVKLGITEELENIDKLTDAAIKRIEEAVGKLGDLGKKGGETMRVLAEKTFDWEGALKSALGTLTRIIGAQVAHAESAKDAVREILKAVAAEAAAYAAAWAFRTLPPLVAFGVAVASAAAAGALIRGLETFHEGGIIGPSSGTRFPGMEADERAIKVRVGESVVADGQSGSNINVNVGMTLPANRIQLRKWVRDDLLPELQVLGVV